MRTERWNRWHWKYAVAPWLPFLSTLSTRNRAGDTEGQLHDNFNTVETVSSEQSVLSIAHLSSIYILHSHEHDNVL